MLSEIYSKHDPDYVDRYMTSRRRLELAVIERSNVSSRHRSWQVLTEVDGLKNTEIASFVTSTSAHDESILWERIIPSARTWMKFLAHNFVLVEDSMMIRFALRQCLDRETAHYTVFECRNEATYILTRKCTDDYYGWKGPCCKVDDAFNFLVNDEPRLFAEIKYIVHADDDTYWRVDQLMKFLAAVDNAGLDRYPIIGNAGNTNPGNMGVWHINNCREIMASGWMQPMLLNHAALERLKIPSASYGLMDTCRNFDVTHDVGVEVYAWLLQFYHMWIPMIEVNGDHQGESILKPNLLAVHAIKHDDSDKCHSGDERKWPDEYRYNQHVVMGCGDIDTKAPFHNSKRIADMYDAYRYFRDNGVHLTFGHGENGFEERKVVYDPEAVVTDAKIGKTKRLVKHILSDNEVEASKTDHTFQGLTVETAVIPKIYYIQGYETTNHFKHNNITGKAWKEFTLKDCKVAGMVSHRYSKHARRHRK
jgi:hypothetical protein